LEDHIFGVLEFPTLKALFEKGFDFGLVIWIVIV
jgi:hypothetical protein